jgi:IclR family pca regulon transcriptional regulator
MTAMSPIRGAILHLPTSQESRYSQSLERGLALLRSFTPEQPWMGLAELADVLEMSRPTTHRYSTTLVVLGYLEQGPRRKYRLGARAGDPGRSAIDSMGLQERVWPCLSDLRLSTSCTASLAVLDDKDIVYVDRARSSWQGHSEIGARLGRGSRLPASETAMGRTLLAQSSPERQLELIDSFADGSDSTEVRNTRDALLEELERIRMNGFAVADQAHVSGQRCVAAPVVVAGADEAIAAVDVAAPKSVITRAQLLERLAPLVVESAAEIAARLSATT